MTMAIATEHEQIDLYPLRGWPGLYSSLLLSEKLYPHLLEIDKTAQKRMDTMLSRIMEAAGITEERKFREAMTWVERVNTPKAQIEELILSLPSDK